MGTTSRFGLTTWDAGTDPFTRTQMNTILTTLGAASSGAAGYGQGVGTSGRASMPDSEYAGFFWFDETADILYFCDGAAWHSVYGAGTIGATNLATDAVETAKIKDLNVTVGKLAGGITADKITSLSTTQLSGTITNAQLAGSITADKIVSLATSQLTGTISNAQLASGIDASKLTTGTLPAARLGAGSVTNTYLGSDINAAKITAGYLPIARVEDGTVTNAKLASGISAAKVTTGTLPNDQAPVESKTYWGTMSGPTERTSKFYVTTTDPPSDDDGYNYDICIVYV